MRLIDPQKARTAASVASTQDSHRTIADHGLQSSRDVNDVRSFPSPTKLDIAHNEGGQCASLAREHSKIVELVANGQNQ